jgi:succinoglycan biosynthesis protein ExoA
MPVSLPPTSRNVIGSVTLVAPMRNEAPHVEAFVEDVAAQDYDGALELVVADGRSSDGSRELLVRAAERAGVRLTLLDNPKLLVSHALNLCIAESAGDMIVRLDLHSRYPRGYVRLLVETAHETGAWNVGGVVVPTGTTPMERAVAAAMDSPFGGIGWTRLAGTEAPVEVDTVTFGAFRSDVFDAVGLFDESLVRNQDDEFNLRLRLAGGTVVLNPGVRVHYVPRGTFRGVLRQYYEYGRWKIPVMRKHRRVLGARSLAPAAFVASVTATAALSPWLVPARTLLAAEVGLYGAAAVTAGVLTLRRRDERVSLLPRVLAAYVAFHAGYGAGMLRGLLPR